MIQKIIIIQQGPSVVFEDDVAVDLLGKDKVERSYEFVLCEE